MKGVVPGTNSLCRCQAQPQPQVEAPRTATYSQVQLVTQSDCNLAVARYPTFRYNASGGGGWGRVESQEGSLLRVVFDAEALVIPALSFKTASIFNVPIPPPLNIAINSKKLEGTIDLSTGEVNLDFSATFDFTAGPLYRAPSLLVQTTLTTESSAGVIHQARGSRMKEGRATLVGVARVPKVEDMFLNAFLFLPTDALAVMQAELVLS